MLITNEFTWDYPTFEAHVEGLRPQIAAHPSSLIPFIATTTPLSILTLFATWKEGKVACPLSPRLPTPPSHLFTPTFPTPSPPSPTQWNIHQIATHLYTSGSSGPPKIACHTLENLLLSAKGSMQKNPLTPQSSWHLSLPLYHVGGLGILFRCYLAKASVLLTSSLSLATHLSLVPTQLYRLLKEKPPLPRLQTILLGGVPLPTLSTLWNILPTYGMTEMSSQIVTDHTLHPYAELTLSPAGEIWVRGKTLFQGYLQSDGSLSLPLNKDGWFETGDLGAWNHGQFHIIGRKDNLFISGGENIQPEEIEAAIHTHCHLDAIVIPLPDEEFGARPGVFLTDPSLLPLIQTQLLSILPKFKIPIRAFPLPPSALAQAKSEGACQISQYGGVKIEEKLNSLNICYLTKLSASCMSQMSQINPIQFDSFMR